METDMKHEIERATIDGIIEEMMDEAHRTFRQAQIYIRKDNDIGSVPCLEHIRKIALTKMAEMDVTRRMIENTWLISGTDSEKSVVKLRWMRRILWICHEVALDRIITINQMDCGRSVE